MSGIFTHSFFWIGAMSISPLIDRLYKRRGITEPEQAILNLQKLLPASSLLGIDNAVAILDAAIDKHEKIVIVGDFDADGATSTSIMILALRDMGANVDFIVPDRFKYGYGLSPGIVDLANELFTPKLLVTVDNGISSFEGVDRANELGIPVLITDHHLTTKAAPPAAGVVNPNQLGCDFKSKSLVGVGVAFYILATLASVRAKEGKLTSQLTKYLDIVALGTIADVGGLDQNNRILVDAGMKRIRLKQCRPGILALLEVGGKEASTLQAQDLGFVLGPRINAAGRMDNMRIGIECLIAPTFDEAMAIATELEKLNVTRRKVEGEMKEAALALIDKQSIDSLVDGGEVPRVIVVYDESWHQGVMGIVAGRMKERFHRPAIVFAPSDDGIMIKGSARSIPSIHIRDEIERIAEARPDMIGHFGGHAAAAGLAIPKEMLGEFQKLLNDSLARHPAHMFDEVIDTDGALEPREISMESVEDINLAGPWGQAFPYPLFEGEFDVISYRWLKDVHLKLTLRHPHTGEWLDAIYFNSNTLIDMTPNSLRVHLVYQLSGNEYKGKTKAQLMVQKARVL